MSQTDQNGQYEVAEDIDDIKQLRAVKKGYYFAQDLASHGGDSSVLDFRSTVVDLCGSLFLLQPESPDQKYQPQEFKLSTKARKTTCEMNGGSSLVVATMEQGRFCCRVGSGLWLVKIELDKEDLTK